MKRAHEIRHSINKAKDRAAKAKALALGASSPKIRASALGLALRALQSVREYEAQLGVSR